MAKYQAMVQDCATKEGATEADVMEALSFEVPSTQSGKCLHACIGSSAGTVSQSVNHILYLVLTNNSVCRLKTITWMVQRLLK